MPYIQCETLCTVHLCTSILGIFVVRVDELLLWQEKNAACHRIFASQIACLHIFACYDVVYVFPIAPSN